MQPPIKIQKDGRHIDVKFSYNTDLVDIMRDLNGIWVYKRMCWMFPASMKSKLVEELKKNGYRVNILQDVKKKETKSNVVSTSFEERFNDPDVIGVYSNCVKCGEYASLDIKKRCFRCRD